MALSCLLDKEKSDAISNLINITGLVPRMIQHLGSSKSRADE
jgi:hypothetical protein